jgi:hypothetical protein
MFKFVIRKKKEKTQSVLPFEFSLLLWKPLAAPDTMVLIIGKFQIHIYKS